MTPRPRLAAQRHVLHRMQAAGEKFHRLREPSNALSNPAIVATPGRDMPIDLGRLSGVG
jgi:hypothetical protein